MFKKAGFFSAFLIPSITVLGYYGGGWWNLSAIIFIFLIIPISDAIVGVDTHNHPETDKAQISNEGFYKWITYSWIPAQFIFLFWAVFQISKLTDWTSIEFLSLLIGSGLTTGGIGITVAHELGHKNNSTEQFLSQLLLMSVCYMHFFIEHNRGHHVQVATPEDPATARKGENFYSFLFRSVVMGWLHAWTLERESLSRKNLSVLSWKNKMIWYSVLPVIFCFALVLFGRSFQPESSYWAIIIFFAGQSFVAFTLLELVNYVEHYGITRSKLPDGRYERVNPLHSWNTAYLISNFFLFQLQRHSDHHTYASKRYQVLDHFDESPQLPFGYPTMILMALVPPIWFSVMDEKLDEWRKGLPLSA